MEKKQKKKVSIEEFFDGNERKIQIAYLLKCVFLDFMLDYPKDAWLSPKNCEIKNQASGMFLACLDKEHEGSCNLSLLYHLIFLKNERIFILNQIKEQAIDFVREHIVFN